MVAFKIIQLAACLSLAISGNAVSLRGRKLLIEADCVKPGAKMVGGTCVGGAVTNFERKLLFAHGKPDPKKLPQ